MNFALLTSEITVVVLALLLIAFDLLLPREETRRSLGYLAVCGLIGILVFTSTRHGTAATLYNGFFIVDSYALFFKQLFLTATLFTIVFSFDYVEKMTRNCGEFYALLLFALVGMMVMVSASDLLTLFIGLELMTIVFYTLVGFDLKNVKSSEAGIKYMILGSVATAVMLYGISWIYGFTGSLIFKEIAAKATNSPAMLLGIALMLGGFGFKLSLAPFHMWAPDVYEGAPTPITAMLAMASKAAAFAVFIRVFLVAFGNLEAYWTSIITILAGASMILGIVTAMWQTNTKRMLAYSSIAQAGYILSGLLALDSVGVKGMLFYAVMYMVANIGVFTVIAALNNHSDSENIADLAGLSQKSPLLAVVMTISLLSMAGLPPMAGFAGKFYIFMAIVDKGYLWLALLGLIMSMISVYYYMNVVKVMYSKPAIDGQELSVCPSIRAVAFISMFATLCVGIYPGPLAEFAKAAAQALW